MRITCEHCGFHNEVPQGEWLVLYKPYNPAGGGMMRFTYFPARLSLQECRDAMNAYLSKLSGKGVWDISFTRLVSGNELIDNSPK